MTKDLRRVRTPHARSDRIDCQVLANLYNTYPEQLDRLYLPSGAELTLQRACRAFARRRTVIAAIDNRLTAYDNWAWQGLSHLVPARPSSGCAPNGTTLGPSWPLASTTWSTAWRQTAASQEMMAPWLHPGDNGPRP